MRRDKACQSAISSTSKKLQKFAFVANQTCTFDLSKGSIQSDLFDGNSASAINVEPQKEGYSEISQPLPSNGSSS